MARILMYNIESKKAAQMKLLFSRLGLDYRTVEPEEFAYPLKVLLDLGESEPKVGECDFDEEMLYLDDINGDMLNILLYQLRKNDLTVALKAVRTDSNIEFSSYELYTELSAEREAIANNTTAHQQ